jgi:hypothetical protein
MRLLPPALLASLLVFAPVSCKRTGEDDTSGPSESKRGRKEKRPPSMPKPLKLPREPVAALHVDNLAITLRGAADLEASASTPRQLIGQALQQASLGFEQQLLPHVALRRPIDIAVVDGQTIVHAPINAKHVSKVAQMLAGKKPVGKFGAVDLGRPQGAKGPKLAYLDTKAKTLTLADDLRGLATGLELAPTYGKRPLYVKVTRAEARKWGVELPVATVEIKGKGAHDFELVATGLPKDRPEMNMVADGALTGLLQYPDLAVGATSKYANYQQVVNDTINEASHQVNRQNFLVKGVLSDLLNRAKVVMRSWNGRIMVGTGPQQHALVAMGVQDANKAQDATLHLIAGITGNLKTARSIGISVPRIRFVRKWGASAGVEIHALILENAAGQVPPEYRQLLNPEGELRVAMAFSPRMGAAMFVIGPMCGTTIKNWLQASTKATPGRESLGHTVAARFAVPPQQLATTLQDSTGSAALNLNATIKPTDIVAERRDDRLKVTVKGPGLTAATKAGKQGKKGKRAKPANRTAPRRAGGKPATRTSP